MVDNTQSTQTVQMVDNTEIESTDDTQYMKKKVQGVDNTDDTVLTVDNTDCRHYRWQIIVDSTNGRRYKRQTVQMVDCTEG